MVIGQDSIPLPWVKQSTNLPAKFKFEITQKQFVETFGLPLKNNGLTLQINFLQNEFTTIMYKLNTYSMQKLCKECMMMYVRHVTGWDKDY